MSTYLVTAYRWGNANGHQYQVYAGTDLTKASALAHQEREERGGKYDCAVYEFNEDGTDYKLIEWVPSYGDTNGPMHNFRIDYFESLGHILDDYVEGRAWMPNPEEPGFLTMQKVDPPPQFVLDAVKRKKDFYDAMEKAQEERNAVGKNEVQS